MLSPAAGGLDDYAEKATIGLLNYSTIRNGFFLGQTEFHDLAGPVDWKELQELGVRQLLVIAGCLVDANSIYSLYVVMACVGDKVAVICNPHDTWFSQRSWEEMWLAVPNVKVWECLIARMLSLVCPFPLRKVINVVCRLHAGIYGRISEA